MPALLLASGASEGGMRLSEILSLERIDTQLSAMDKPEVLRALSALIAREQAQSAGNGSNGSVTNVEAVARVLGEREALASTGVGDGVAIPHGRLPGLDHFVAALAIRREGVPFDAIDGRPASIFFAVVGPERASGEHLKCLARIGRVLRDDGVRMRLLQAEKPSEALAIVVAAEGP
jgi:PTS system nitrogen regulatory IIA component